MTAILQWHFRMNFHEWNYLHFDLNLKSFSKFVFKLTNPIDNKNSIGSGNGLVVVLSQ